MRALLLGQLVLALSHDAAARGQLRLLERFAEQTELVISLGPGNAISDSAREALRRWPALVAVELHFPLSGQDASGLRRLGRLAVRLPPIAAVAALPSSSSSAPSAEATPAQSAAATPAQPALSAPGRYPSSTPAPARPPARPRPAAPGTEQRAASGTVSLRDARREQPSLALLGPALVRVERAPDSPLAPGPCPGSEERVLPDGASELRLDGAVTQCELDWLRARLEPHPEPAGDLPPEMLAPAPTAAPPRRK